MPRFVHPRRSASPIRQLLQSPRTDMWWGTVLRAQLLTQLDFELPKPREPEPEEEEAKPEEPAPPASPTPAAPAPPSPKVCPCDGPSPCPQCENAGSELHSSREAYLSGPWAGPGVLPVGTRSSVPKS